MNNFNNLQQMMEEVDGMIDFLFLLIGIVVLFGGAALVIYWLFW